MLKEENDKKLKEFKDKQSELQAITAGSKRDIEVRNIESRKFPHSKYLNVSFLQLDDA